MSFTIYNYTEMSKPGKRCVKWGHGVRFGNKYGYSVDDRNNYDSITYRISEREFIKMSIQICVIDDFHNIQLHRHV